MVDISILRKNIRGIKGAFLTKDGDVLEVDIEISRELERVSWNIFYLWHVACDKKGDIRRLSIEGSDLFFLFFHDPYALGVVASPDTNMSLLNVLGAHIMELVEEPGDAPRLPRTLAREVPCFNQPREKVLEDAPTYASQVLQFVDGTRTVKDIIKQSKLPPEVVLDVILAYNRTSALMFRDIHHPHM